MIRALAFIGIVLVSAVGLSAHHGFGTFDLSRSVTFTGTLTRVQFVNPHSWLYFDVKDASGKVTNHRCEMRSAHTLRRSGWSAELFPVGAVVTIEAAPDKADPNSCYLNTIRFQDGSHMDRYGQYVKAPEGGLREVRGAVVVPDTRFRPKRLPNGQPYLAGDWAPEQVVMADPRGTGGGLVPLSSLEAIDKGEQPGRAGGGGRGGGRGAGPRLYGGTELTARGEREAAAFTRDDNPRFRCETTSILFDWTFDGPVNRIIQTTNTVVLRYGQLNFERTIHLNQTKPPAGVKPSRAGYSIGRWEGDTLVVETTNFLPGVLNAPVRHSDQLKVVERFTLDPETVRLTREYVATDPVYLKGEYRGRDVVQIADAPYAKDNCNELGFIDYSKQQAN